MRAESCTICSSCSRQPVWKLLDTPLNVGSHHYMIHQFCVKHSLYSVCCLVGLFCQGSVLFVKNIGDKSLEQRININLIVKLEKDAIGIYKLSVQHI
jgi:hypothetical protein